MDEIHIRTQQQTIRHFLLIFKISTRWFLIYV